ncbi:hypothetical protein M885DRAFT_551946 [Pelagophyceae sp. CCMP2097]|nr:hypothetical protein M885DRAFT_551946 [Pelagophyceae sp. CCMP2097]
MEERHVQREQVRRLFERSAVLQRGGHWAVISQKWWSSWRESVGYHLTVEGLALEQRAAAADVGPINNEPLLTRQGSRWYLRIGLVEHDDYALVPAEVWELLLTWYGGGPTIERKVVGHSAGELRVEVYRLRFDVRVAKAEGRVDAGSETFVVRSRCDSAGDTRRAIVEAVALPPAETRVWLKAAAEDDAEDDRQTGAVGPLSEQRFWKTRPAARVAADDNEDDDGWRLLADDDDAALGLVAVVAAASEARRWGAVVEARCADGSWPRDARRTRWRAALRVGQVVDARDSEGRWFDAVVVDLDAVKGAKVHFRGWSSKWDAWLGLHLDDAPLAQLFTHTDDWRRLRRGDACEVRSEDAVKPLWYEARVTDIEVDAGGRVEVSPLTAGTAASQHMAPRWVETASEEICKMGTHIKKASAPRAAAAADDAAPRAAAALAPRAPAPAARSERPTRANSRGAPPAPGAVGLSNLGNTCFMNSMLQCLSHTAPLTAYFLRDATYEAELNVSNPLGAGGAIARAYADFVRDVWSGQYSVVAPTVLKRAVGTHAPQFVGYQQHDSHELMCFMLDGLHEDLNRVKTKPYTATIESDGRPDREVADETWETFSLRNRSVVVDHCYGQLKSHITCPHCSNESITFDPYLSLTLPLPAAAARRLTVALVRLESGARPRKLTVEVAASDTVAALKDALRLAAYGADAATAADLDVCDVWGHRVYATFAENFSVENIKTNDDVVAYVLEERPALPGARPEAKRAFRTIDVVFGRRAAADAARAGPRRAAAASRQGAAARAGGPAAPDDDADAGARSAAPADGDGADDGAAAPRAVQYDLYGVPLRLAVDDATTCADVRARIATHVRRFARVPPDAAGAPGADVSYGIAVSKASGTRFDSDLPYGDAELPAGTQVLTVEFSGDIDSAELDACDVDVSAAPAAAGAPIDVLDCLRKLLEREQLGESEQWYCGKCERHSRAFKKLDLWTTPEVLIVHLNRFKYAQNAFFVRRQKIDDLVTFPLRALDLGPYTLNKQGGAVYDLYAVSEHSGGMGGGHYQAKTLNDADGAWYHFNDSLVSLADEASIVSPEAYVLFYKRRKPQP